MPDDPVSDLLALVEARCVVTGGLRAGGTWTYRSVPDSVVKIDAVVSGTCWLLVDGHDPVQLGSGDAVVMCGVTSALLCSERDSALGEVWEPSEKRGFFSRIGDGDPDVVVIGGHVDLDPASTDLFVSAFPSVLYAPAADAEAAEIRRLLDRIVAENDSDRPGASFAADQYAQLLLLEVLRAGMRRGSMIPPGWLRLFMDARLRPAIRLMHDEPGRAWRLPELAAASNMSRSYFARQFQEVSGQPPLTYLSDWRIRLAQRALRTTDATVAALAEQLGYASESSFSHAFTRITGTPPARYRQRHRRLAIAPQTLAAPPRRTG